jgi:hypothetical protein
MCVLKVLLALRVDGNPDHQARKEWEKSSYEECAMLEATFLELVLEK